MSNTNRIFLERLGNPNDDYYTLYEDVRKDLEHYKEHFRGKTIYCPCDDYRWSNFVKYFKDNFRTLGLKTLLASNYDIGDGAYAYKYDGKVEITLKLAKGDFLTTEVDNPLRTCDIIVTNPPFSLLRKIFDRIREAEKDFIIMGPLTAAAYSNVLPYIVSGEVNVDSKRSKTFSNGKKLANIIWLTTFTPPRHSMEFTEAYAPEKYRRYDRYPDTINVDRSKDIPKDYYGKMGAPLSFIKYLHREEFNLLGEVKEPFIEGAKKFRRLLVQRKKQEDYLINGEY